MAPGALIRSWGPEPLAFPAGSVEKNLPASAGDRVGSLDQEDPLEKEMATLSSILVWRIPGTEEPGRPQSMGSQRAGHDLATEHTRWET